MLVASLVRFPGVFLISACSLVLMFDWFGALVGFPRVIVVFLVALVGFVVRSLNNLVLH